MQTHWSTAAVSPGHRFEYWREVICDAFLPLQPISPEGPVFHGRVDAIGLRDFHLATVRANAHTVTRTASGIARTRTGAFFANYLRSGTASVEQAGRSAHAVAGEIVFLDTDEPFVFDIHGACDVVCLTIPQEWIRARLGKRGRPDSPVLSVRTPAGRLAAAYLRALSTEGEADLLELEDTVFDHLSELLARGARPLADLHSQRDRLRMRIVRFIDAHLDDPTLTARTACDALGVSRSFLYGVLVEAGLTFAGEVRKRRLAAVDRDLANPHYRHLTVAEIASRWCFVDASSFTRTYRAAFARTPGSHRVALPGRR